MKFDKRKIIILSLVFVLISISYLNYMINKQSILETSSEFTEYEENKLSTMEAKEKSDDIIIQQNISEDGKDTSSITMVADDSSIVDSKENNLSDIVAASNSNIEETLLNDEMSKSAYFLQAKIDVEMEREKTIERFDEIINNKMVDEQSRKNAVQRKMSLIDTMNKEKIIESLIKGKGFEDAVVFITNESVYVTVLSEKLSNVDVAKILDIVTRETDVSIDNIKIQNK
jgi:stage III sporulation protein AH